MSKSKSVMAHVNISADIAHLIRSPIIPDQDQEAARAAMKICTTAEAAYRIRGVYKQGECANVLILPSFRYFAFGFKYKEISVAQIGLANPAFWEKEVHKTGLDVIEGRLILAVLQREESQAIVLLVEQGRGMSLKPAIATAAKGPNDIWKLEGNPNLHHPALATLCARQQTGVAFESTDALYNAYITLGRYTQNELEEMLLTQRRTSIPAKGSDQIN